MTNPSAPVQSPQSHDDSSTPAQTQLDFAQSADVSHSDAKMTPVDGDEIDMSSLLANIRARYRLLCSSLGVKPRLTALSATGDGGVLDANEVGGIVQGIEGPMKGVNTKQLLY